MLHFYVTGGGKIVALYLPLYDYASLFSYQVIEWYLHYMGYSRNFWDLYRKGFMIILEVDFPNS